MPQKTINRDLLSSSEKCFMALELLNAVGPLKISELSPRLGVPRTTAVRVLRTLSARGYIARGKDNRFRISAGVNRLSSGYRESGTIVPRIETIMAGYARDFVWPLTMVLPRPDAMYSCVTTDELTPFKMFANPTGTRIPYFGTASGTVYLAFCPDSERTIILRLARSDPHSREVKPED
ncbi:MAG: helix-turn-helix domain-containing protein, partial [Rhodobacteraceae bacterium]|nr:helix-turn-helix domain-containing protein [Paracoccaceae bacterium]